MDPRCQREAELPRTHVRALLPSARSNRAQVGEFCFKKQMTLAKQSDGFAPKLAYGGEEKK